MCLSRSLQWQLLKLSLCHFRKEVTDTVEIPTIAKFGVQDDEFEIKV